MRPAPALFFASLVPALVMASCAADDSAAVPSLPRDLKTWTADYVVIGGLAGITRHVTVSSDGAVVVQDRFAAATHVEGRVGDALVAKIAALLRVARIEKPPKGPPMPDAAGTVLTVKADGREYPVETTPEIVALLDEAAEAAQKQSR